MRAVRVSVFLLLGVLSASGAMAATVTRVFGFTLATGGRPVAPLLQASDGNFYGTTSTGGDDGAGCAHSCLGTVFKLTPQGQYTILHTFAYGSGSPAYPDGSSPMGGLVEGPDGWLYGTTNTGGNALSYGIVYKISKTGQFVKLHDFCPASPCPDGTQPTGELVFGRDGYLYGTTTGPVANPRIFRISTDGTYEAMAQFSPTGLSGPSFGMLLASDGAFYGVTNNGIYRFVPGVGITTLYVFTTQSNDGLFGRGPLIQATDGYLYGGTYEGLGTAHWGTVFRIARDGTGYQKILDLVPADEGTGSNAVIQASDGTLWGTTQSTTGGAYSITTSGTYLQHALFTSDTGKTPYVHLTEATDGKLYGTSYTLGPGGYGAVFTVDAGLPSPAPGEAAAGETMKVTAYDKATGDITVSYGAACFATDHHIVFGPLSAVAAYAYSGQACHVGNYGSATFNPGSGSFFWVIVGNTPELEGSYGKASSGAERPEAVGLAACDYPQDLTGGCP